MSPGAVEGGRRRNLLRAFSLIDPGQYLRSQKLSDVRLVASNGELQAHKIILASACPLLKPAMLGNDEEEVRVHLPDYSVSDLEDFLTVIYCRKKTGDISSPAADLLTGWGFEYWEGVEPDPISTESVTLGSNLVQPIQLEFGDDFDDVEQVKVFDEIEDVVETELGEAKLPAAPDNRRWPFASRLVHPKPEYNHVKLKQNADGSYSCPIISCDVRKYGGVSFVWQHLTSAHTRVSCHICGARTRPKSLAEHMVKAHGDEDDTARTILAAGRLLCPAKYCRFVCDDDEVLERHKEAHVRATCLHCGRAVIKTDLDSHIELEHSNSKRSRTSRFRCLECFKRFGQRESMLTHMRERHCMVEARVMMCKVCERMAGSAGSMPVHEATCVPPPNKSKAFYGRRKSRVKHIKVPVNEADPEQCPFPGCVWRDPVPYKVRGHYLGTHCRLKCPYCGKSLSRYHMDRHIALTHTKNYAHMCPKCGAGFHTARELVDHDDAEHIKELKFVCEDCGRAFFSRRQMYSHSFKEHRTGRLPCPFGCPKDYSEKCSLIKHLRSVHGGNGINELYKDKKTGKYKYMRNLKNVKDESLDAAVEASTMEYEHGLGPS